MSLTYSALASHQQHGAAPQSGRSPIPSTAGGSEVDTDVETMSHADSSDSGNSIEIGGTNDEVRRLREEPKRMRDIFLRKEKEKAAMNTAIASAVAKHQRDDPLDGARSYCSMCSINPSEYLCTHCGRLSFCTKCCLNLHDNKYLCGHTFVVLDSIPQGDQCTLDDIKGKKRQREDDERVSRKVLQSSSMLRTGGGAADAVPVLDQAQRQAMGITAANGKNGANQSIANATAAAASAKNIDMASLTADKSVINVRLRELATCLESGQQLHRELANERNTTKETTATAVEAVRRRFDVLRQLINAKEEQFVAVVEQAGRERFDLATAATCSINIATSELDGFIAHMHLQMDRLEENKVQFNAQRQGMLDSTYKNLTAVDGWTHDHQSRLQEIRSMSLGVHVPIDGAAEAIQTIQPPKYLSYRGTEEGRQGILSIQEAAVVPMGEIVSPVKARQPSAVPAAKFVETPGVKVVVQSQVHRNPMLSSTSLSAHVGLNSTVGSRNGSPFRANGGQQQQQQVTGRKLHTVEQQELRNTPMRDVVRPPHQQQQQQQQQGGGVVRKAASPMRSSGGGHHSASMALNATAISHQNASTLTSMNASAIHTIPTAAAGPSSSSRNGTPTRRVMYGRSDSNSSGVQQQQGGGVGRPSVAGRASLAATNGRPNDLYTQRVVTAAIRSTSARAHSPGGTTQRFTTSPLRATSPVRTGGGTSSFALPTGNAVRRGGSPLRGPASSGGPNASMYRGSTDNPGPGAYNVASSSFGGPRKVASPMRR